MDALKLHPEIEFAKIFGSRALQTNRPGSDIDIALFGEGITLTIILSLVNAFDESDIPYLVDIIKYNSINNNDLKQHIDQNGITFYNKQSTKPHF